MDASALLINFSVLGLEIMVDDLVGMIFICRRQDDQKGGFFVDVKKGIKFNFNYCMLDRMSRWVSELKIWNSIVTVMDLYLDGLTDNFGEGT